MFPLVKSSENHASFHIYFKAHDTLIIGLWNERNSRSGGPENMHRIFIVLIALRPTRDCDETGHEVTGRLFFASLGRQNPFIMLTKFKNCLWEDISCDILVIFTCYFRS